MHFPDLFASFLNNRDSQFMEKTLLMKIYQDDTHVQDYCLWQTQEETQMDRSSS